MTIRLTSFVAVFALTFILLMNVAAAETVTTTSNAGTRPDVGPIQEMIKSLLERIKTLQGNGAGIKAEVQETNKEIREYIKSDLRVGTTSDHVKKVQEILAADPTIYPRGLVTGYFGPMTSEALKKFQEKFDLEVTGEMNEETKEAMNALLEERFEAGKVPQGLLGAPGIMKRFVERLQDGCSDALKATGVFCLEMKKKHNWGDNASSTNNGNNASSSEASLTARGMLVQKAIDSASTSIAALEEAIEDYDEDDADDGDGEEILEAAEADLESAEDLLEEAKELLEEEKYVTATRKALAAKRTAKSGLNELD